MVWDSTGPGNAERLGRADNRDRKVGPGGGIMETAGGPRRPASKAGRAQASIPSPTAIVGRTPTRAEKFHVSPGWRLPLRRGRRRALSGRSGREMRPCCWATHASQGGRPAGASDFSGPSCSGRRRRAKKDLPAPISSIAGPNQGTPPPRRPRERNSPATGFAVVMG